MKEHLIKLSVRGFAYLNSNSLSSQCVSRCGHRLTSYSGLYNRNPVGNLKTHSTPGTPRVKVCSQLSEYVHPGKRFCLRTNKLLPLYYSTSDGTTLKIENLARRENLARLAIQDTGTAPRPANIRGRNRAVRAWHMHPCADPLNSVTVSLGRRRNAAASVSATTGARENFAHLSW